MDIIEYMDEDGRIIERLQYPMVSIDFAATGVSTTSIFIMTGNGLYEYSMTDGWRHA